MPDVPSAILFLGDRSPYGLSVARALVGSRLPLRGVVVPSERAHALAQARAHAAARTGTGAADLVRRAARRLGRKDTPEALEGLGDPIPPLELDPGITLASLREGCVSARVDWQEADEIGSESFLRWMGQMAPSLLLSAAFPLIFGPRLLALAPLGAVNFHPSLLPRCRGCHPIFWTLASGETVGGVTAHYMSREVDSGPVIAQISIPLSDEDDYRSLYARCMQASVDLVTRVEEFFLAGGGAGIPQDESRATYHHEDTPEDHRIHWAGRSPREVVALARTLEAFTLIRGLPVGVLKAQELHHVARERRLSRPGQIISVHEAHLEVAASGGPVALLKLSWRGRAFGGGELARRLGLRRGEVLG